MTSAAQVLEDAGVTEDEVTAANQLPSPKGYRILIHLPDQQETSEGGILMPGDMVNREQTGSVTARVIEMGDLCYLDKERFPTGPWCEVGDWVMMRSYSGTRFTVHGKEFRLINDDSVEAVVIDPKGIAKL